MTFFKHMRYFKVMIFIMFVSSTYLIISSYERTDDFYVINKNIKNHSLNVTNSPDEQETRVLTFSREITLPSYYIKSYVGYYGSGENENNIIFFREKLDWSGEVVYYFSSHTKKLTEFDGRNIETIKTGFTTVFWIVFAIGLIVYGLRLVLFVFEDDSINKTITILRSVFMSTQRDEILETFRLWYIIPYITLEFIFALTITYSLIGFDFAWMFGGALLYILLMVLFSYALGNYIPMQLLRMNKYKYKMKNLEENYKLLNEL